MDEKDESLSKTKNLADTTDYTEEKTGLIYHLPLIVIILIAAAVISTAGAIVLFSLNTYDSYAAGENKAKATNIKISPTTQITPKKDINKITWTIFTDNKKKFSINIPDNWEAVSTNAALNIGPKNDLPRLFVKSFTGNIDNYVKKNYMDKNVSSSSASKYENTEYDAVKYDIDYFDKVEGFGVSERTLVIFSDAKIGNFLFDSYGKPDDFFEKISSSFKFIIKNNPSPTITDSGSETGACTQELKECPDGSYVSRSGPKCEFATCPK